MMKLLTNLLNRTIYNIFKLFYESEEPVIISFLLIIREAFCKVSVFIGSTVLASGISSIRRTKIFIYSSGFALASNVVLSVILIPRFNIIGAAIAYSSMNAVNFTIVYYYSRKFGVNNYDISRIIKIWISSLIMFGSISLLYAIMNIMAVVFVFGLSIRV